VFPRFGEQGMRADFTFQAASRSRVSAMLRGLRVVLAAISRMR
jgi:hypothetical protein